ncbi:MAG TPA: TetR/AcrR family transcriptional regulator [Solirubrobacterales bacterium]|jgi:AcrR family transcriptional regulator|nr:TetR/AcrR family transcriptional regulator [Solirubrobacterales bacterium]
MRQEACAAAGEALPVETTAPTPDATVREGEMEGALHVVGELGYRGASVRAVLEYSGGHRKQFYDHFESLEDCFEQAYGTWIERLGVSLLEAAVSASGWGPGVRAGLIRLFGFVTEQPQIARSLFVEVQVAGGAAMTVHDEALERLAVALDSVRSEIEPGQAPPEATGIFVVGGIEACICEVLAEGNQNRIWDALPELMHLAVGSYLGKEAAEEAFEEAKVLLERDRAGLAGGEA